MVGIHQLWVLEACRGQRIASQLMDAVRQNFVFGMQVPREMLCFSSPTQAGAKFAKSYGGDGDTDVLVYDCK